MQLSQIQSCNYNPGFKAKFIDTPALRQVVQWAADNGKFDALNEARKRIDYSAVKIRIELDLGTNIEGYPLAIFRRFYPRDNISEGALTEDCFLVSRPITYKTKRKISPVEYGYRKIIQMSQNIGENWMFREIVLHPPKYTNR